MIVSLRAGFGLAVLFLFSLAALPLQALALTKRGWLKRRVPLLWHRAAALALGLRVVVEGRPATGRPLLLVSNHQSWADIVALGSVVEASFIAKSQVRGWPGIGTLARLQRTVFVAREARGDTGRQANAIADRLAAGDAMVLFAEGTTSDGNAVLPFKSALFGAAQGALAASGREAVLVQPVSVAYTRSHGLPLGRSGRPLAAWPGDVALVPHLRAFLRNGAVDAEIRFGEPLVFTARTSRKVVAKACEDAVARMLVTSLRGGGPEIAVAVIETTLASGLGRTDIGASDLRAPPTRTR